MPNKKLTHSLLPAARPGTSTARDVDPPSMRTDRQASEGHTPHTLPLQGLVNRVVRGLLRTPLLCLAVGRWLLTVYVTGRKSGRGYAVPVAYTRNGDSLLIGTSFGWARNLRTGEPVTIRVKGRRRPADVQVLADEPGVVEAYALMARDNHGFAKFNKIGFDQAGDPDRTDLRRAWAAGARAIRLTPHPI
jgi:deazaflavin-dependent oxidoreductase (nitroreductase family)